MFVVVVELCPVMTILVSDSDVGSVPTAVEQQN